MALQNVGAERAVLGGICKHGRDAYVDVADIVQSSSFTINTNAVMFDCLKRLFEENINAVPDPTIIVNTAKQLGYDKLFTEKSDLTQLRAMFSLEIALPNVRKFAAQIRKLEIARQLMRQLEASGEELASISGAESISQILGIAEKRIFDFSNLLNSTNDGPKQIGADVDAYVDTIEQNPNGTIGLSTGFKKYDAAIGGGLRRQSVSLIGARTKAGKSLLAASIGWYVAEKLKVPVLYLDTEMGNKAHYGRMLAWLTGIPINSIESGKWVKNPVWKKAIYEAKERLKSFPLEYLSVPGLPFEEILAHARRWLFKSVPKGGDCLLIYDWFKLAGSDDANKNLQEYQQIGFQLTSLTNFVLRYDIPCLAFTQLNRDGITQESEATISQSDRLSWFCSNFSIFKRKDDNEKEEDDEPDTEFGNRKMIPILSRYSGEWKSKDYINFNVDEGTALVTEGKLRSEIRKLKKTFEPTQDEDNEKL
jgi:replicative DNA helicase